MIERRKWPRVPGCEAARIVFGHGNRLASIILDISSHGARLELANPNEIPARFDLIRARGDCYSCRVVWSKRDQVGVVFQ